MRRIPLRYLKENSITAMDIYNSSGKLLISKSMKIDKNMMELLHKNKIIYVYIMDESREDIIDDVVLCQYFGHKKSNFFMLHF